MHSIFILKSQKRHSSKYFQVTEKINVQKISCMKRTILVNILRNKSIIFIIISFLVTFRLKDSRPLVEAFTVKRIYLAHNKEGFMPDYRVRFYIFMIFILII